MIAARDGAQVASDKVTPQDLNRTPADSIGKVLQDLPKALAEYRFTK